MRKYTSNIIRYVLTDDCNGDCRYCTYKHSLFGRDMSREEVGLSFEKIWPAFTGGFDSIHFFGGEASLRMDLVEEIDGRATEWCQRAGRAVPHYYFSTNLVALNDRIISFLQKNRDHLSILTSFDGIEKYHNLYRDNTSSEIKLNAARLRGMGIKLFSVTAVYHKAYHNDAITPLQIAGEMVRQLDTESITFNLIFSKDRSYQVSYGEFYEVMLDSCLSAVKIYAGGGNDTEAKAAKAFLHVDLERITSPFTGDYFCDFGVDSVTVFPEGLADLCPDQYLFGLKPRLNMYDAGFGSAMAAQRAVARAANAKAGKEECRRCEASKLCHICPLWSDQRKQAHCKFTREKYAILSTIAKPEETLCC